MTFDDQLSIFDEPIDRRGTHCEKWDMMEHLCGVSPVDGLAMWVADSDFRTAPVIREVVAGKAWHGAFGYFGDKRDYVAATQWWLRERHGWEIEPGWIVPLHGLGNALAMTIDVFTEPGDGVIVFSPVYHAFASKIRNADRRVVECPLENVDGRYRLDFNAYDAQMTGTEKLILWSSPHNPGGRVWTSEELRALADFARRHDLILVSDEVHHDIVYPGNVHVPTAIAAPEISDRLVTLAAASKTFNVAGMRVGNAIMSDPDLLSRFKKRTLALALAPNSLGLEMTTAAFSPEGAAWVDAQVAYLDQNRALLDSCFAAIPGVRSMPLESTYLAWVDFAEVALDFREVCDRVEKRAKIAVNRGADFGIGGETFLRFNFAAPRSMIEEAVRRLAEAFADLE